MMKNISNLIVFTIFSFTVATAADTKFVDERSPEFVEYIDYLNLDEPIRDSRNHAKKALVHEKCKQYGALFESQLSKCALSRVDDLSLDELELIIKLCLLKKENAIQKDFCLSTNYFEWMKISLGLPDEIRECFGSVMIPKGSISIECPPFVPAHIWEKIIKDREDKQKKLLRKQYDGLLRFVLYSQGIDLNIENLSLAQSELILKLCDIKWDIILALVKPECPIQAKLGAEWASIFNSLPEELQNCFKRFTVFLEPEKMSSSDLAHDRQLFEKEILLSSIINSTDTEYEKIKKVCSWVSQLFKHNGDNEITPATPLAIYHEAQKGTSMRCVEYSILMAGVFEACGMSARVTGLKMLHADIITSGAGHVVCEVFSKQFDKWIMIDGQWGVIVEHEGIPLNAWEISQMIKNNKTLVVVDATTKEHISNQQEYLSWLEPYLVYFDVDYDQNLYSSIARKDRFKIQLHDPMVPDLKVFQGTSLNIKQYVTDPTVFYADK